MTAAGANDLARRLIEAFDLEDEFDVVTASWVDTNIDLHVVEASSYIPDEAYEE